MCVYFLCPLGTRLNYSLCFAEYDTLQRLGITDGRQFLKRRLKQDEKDLMFLQSCCVGRVIQDHIEAVIDEALTSASWVHVRVGQLSVLGFLISLPCLVNKNILYKNVITQIFIKGR